MTGLTVSDESIITHPLISLETMAQDIIDLFKNPCFNRENLSSSVYRVKKVDQSLNLLPVCSRTLSNHTVLYYHPLEQVIRMLLEQEELMKGFVCKPSEGSSVSDISHFADSKIFKKDYERSIQVSVS